MMPTLALFLGRPHCAARGLKALIEAGEVKVDGALERDPSARLFEGARIDFEAPPAQESPLAGEDLPLKVVFEDEHLTVTVDANLIMLTLLIVRACSLLEAACEGIIPPQPLPLVAAIGGSVISCSVSEPPTYRRPSPSDRQRERSPQRNTSRKIEPRLLSQSQ
jgi:hypothetical protein